MTAATPTIRDTIRRTAYVESKGLLYIGTGVSGGEEGARHGPSIMPGGSPAAWPHVKPIFQAIAAKVADGSPCCDWVGENGAGHYVKMVHNGIEYGDMQLICEAYHLMKEGLGLSADEMHKVFAQWNKGKLDSYLIEITRDILGFKDEDGEPMVDKILDTAGQKGTGKWTGISALDLGIPLTMVVEAVLARSLSALKDERVAASGVLSGPKPRFTGDKKAFVDDLREALYASKIISYTQGYMLMRAAAQEYKWNLNYGGVALMWRGGCIIRSAFLGKIKEAFDRNPKLSNLLLDPYFKKQVEAAQLAWRRVVAKAIQTRNSSPGHVQRAGLLRRVPPGMAARQPASGSARLLWRPHLRARGQAARPVLPHELDRAWRRCDFKPVSGLVRRPLCWGQAVPSSACRVEPAVGAHPLLQTLRPLRRRTEARLRAEAVRSLLVDVHLGRDTCAPQRLEEQQAVLERHRGVLGGVDEERRRSGPAHLGLERQALDEGR